MDDVYKLFHHLQIQQSEFILVWWENAQEKEAERIGKVNFIREKGEQTRGNEFS